MPFPRLVAAAFALSACTALAQTAAYAQAPEVSLTRFECGSPRPGVDVNQRFSDTFAYPGLKRDFVFSCYLIKHGNDYLLWDTGHA